METKAEENKKSKNQFLTEITKIVCMVYFRILKKTPNSKLLSVTLEGLAKYVLLTKTSPLVSKLSFNKYKYSIPILKYKILP